MHRGRINPRSWFRREDGQTMAEYAVVLGMITIGVVATFAALSGSVSSALTSALGAV